MDKDFEKDLELIEVRESSPSRGPVGFMYTYEDDEGCLYYKFIRGETVYWEDDTSKTIFKSCGGCGEMKRPVDFNKNSSHFTGLSHYCKNCL